mgnify:CR=1 FL=1
MNEIEMAIKSFEKFKEMGYSHSDLPSSWSIELALAALREQAERENGCEYCTTGESLNGYDDVGSFAIHPKGKKHYLEVAYNDDFYNCAVYINFCPICGKRLEVEK